MNLPVLGKNSPPASGGGTHEKKAGGFRRKLLRKKVIFPAVACVLVAAAAVHFLGGGQTAQAANQTYVTAAVERRDITAEITGSGTLEAANSYSVTTFVEGTILTADFEEGDQVEEGAVLYTIDSGGNLPEPVPAQLRQQAGGAGKADRHRPQGRTGPLSGRGGGG